MTKEREALKLALEALEEAWYHVGTFQPTEKAIDLYDEARTAIKEALAQSEQDNTYIYASNLAKTIWQKHYMNESPKFALLDTTEGVLTQIDNMTCGLVREKPAQPEQEPVAWKLVPIEPTNEMLKAMDECSTEGYDERLYAGHAASVYMAAIDAAPAQSAQQKPVVWMYQDKSTHEVRFQKHMRDFVDHSKTSEVPLYSESLANHELQCVCGAVWCGDEMVHLPNKIPPQRKPLTDEEIILIVADCASSHQHTDIHFARAIEAAHGIYAPTERKREA